MKYEHLELNDEVRKTLPGEFIHLSKGFVHYELDGPVDGDVVILVHGFSSPLFIWDPTFDFLINNGFKILRYDLYGRGFSDRPETKYNMELFVLQLLELVTKLELTCNEFNLVGLSMGGGICVKFADQNPELVKKVSLVDPIGFPSGNTLPSFFKVPVINRLIIKIIRHDRLLESQREDFYQYNIPEKYLENYTEQMKYKGFLKAIRSTIMNTPFTNLKETYERLGKRELPMQLFWGENDQTIPFSTSKDVRAAVPSIEFHPIRECGHIPHFTHPDEVNPKLLAFLCD
ncbi:MAG: alpha/beta fold hydrolase [Candidatus Hodarchaeales archaeon]|jgi:pimeloyl-ACP methyl ester carboxylesterase